MTANGTRRTSPAWGDGAFHPEERCNRTSGFFPVLGSDEIRSSVLRVLEAQIKRYAEDTSTQYTDTHRPASNISPLTHTNTHGTLQLRA